MKEVQPGTTDGADLFSSHGRACIHSGSGNGVARQRQDVAGGVEGVATRSQTTTVICCGDTQKKFDTARRYKIRARKIAIA
jgi:hypothetical protein